VSLLSEENFVSLNMANGASQNPPFHTDFENVNLILVKSAPKKVFAEKNEELA